MFLQQMDDRVSVHREWFSSYHFHLVDSVDRLRKLVDMCIKRGMYAIDTETTGLDDRIYQDDHFRDGKRTRHGIRTVDQIVGVCISFDGEHGYYVPLGHEPEDSGNLPWDPAWDELERLVNSDAIGIMHNARYDCEMIYPVTGREWWPFNKYEDTLLLARVLNPIHSFPAGLKQLTKIHFGIEMVELDELFTEERKEQLRREKKGYNFAMLHPKEGLEYGCSDGIFTFKLFGVLKQRMSGNDQQIYNLEKSFCNVIRKMVRNRIHLDMDLVKRLSTECDNAIRNTGDLIRGIIEEKTGKTGKWKTLNVGSPKQLSGALITDLDGLRLKPLREMMGDDPNAPSPDEDADDVSAVQYSLNDESLKLLHKAYGGRLSTQREGVVDRDGNPKPESIFELILEYRHYDKMRGSYVGKLMESHDRYGDVRARYNQMGTDTARLSSQAGKIQDGYSGVNFQGIPRDSDDDKPELFKKIRHCIIPRPGKLMVKIDYAGEELRVVTNLSGDPIWTNSFLNEDGDVHSITTRTLYGKHDISKDERNRGKRCNFAFIYGGGAGAISRNVGCTIEEGQRHMDNLRSAVPVLMGYVEGQKKFARKHKCIYTAFGRRIPIPTIDSPIRALRAKAERCAINYTIQSTSADILKLAMCYVDKMIRESGWEDVVKYVMTVHDEVVYEVEPSMLMEVVPKLDEWMVLPWRLPKAHGREWKVPLETEPGVDSSWRAKYDFFQMTRGTDPNPKDLDQDGNFIGKLKSGYYFHNGKVYQEIPDFLKPYVWRPDDGKPERVPDPLPSIDLTPQVESPEPETESPEPSVPEVDPPVQDQDVDDSPVNVATSPLLSDDVSFSSLTEDTPVSSPVSDPTDVGSTSMSESESGSESETSEPVNGEVFQWTFRAMPSKQAIRKIHAICILAEGNVPLRIVNKEGSIFISERRNVMVNPARFSMLAELFGV